MDGKNTHKLQVNAQTTSKMTRASVPTYFQRISKHFTAKERHHFSPSGYSKFNLECTIIRAVIIGMVFVVGSLVEARKTPLLRSILTQKVDGEVHPVYDVSSLSRV